METKIDFNVSLKNIQYKIDKYNYLIDRDNIVLDEFKLKYKKEIDEKYSLESKIERTFLKALESYNNKRSEFMFKFEKITEMMEKNGIKKDDIIINSKRHIKTATYKKETDEEFNNEKRINKLKSEEKTILVLSIIL
jgi:hypothetical protein